MSAPDEGRLLDVRGVRVRFGGIVALDDVSFGIRAGEILGLIGPNGAGKTTLFNCLSRLYRPSAGDILFEGRSILDAPAPGWPRSASGGPSRTWRCSRACRCSTTWPPARTPARAGTRSATRCACPGPRAGTARRWSGRGRSCASSGSRP